MVGYDVDGLDNSLTSEFKPNIDFFQRQGITSTAVTGFGSNH